jgi:hypothetical protein
VVGRELEHEREKCVQRVPVEQEEQRGEQREQDAGAGQGEMKPEGPVLSIQGVGDERKQQRREQQRVWFDRRGGAEAEAGGDAEAVTAGSLGAQEGEEQSVGRGEQGCHQQVALAELDEAVAGMDEREGNGGEQGWESAVGAADHGHGEGDKGEQ